MPFRLSNRSTTSSCTPSMVEYSCNTPLMLTSVGAKPPIDDKRMRRRALPSVCPYPRSNGSIVTFAWNCPRFCTSMMRGLRRVLLCIGYASTETSCSLLPLGRPAAYLLDLPGRENAIRYYLEYSSTTSDSLIVAGRSERCGADLNTPFI